jgi:hypothetical protein
MAKKPTFKRLQELGPDIVAQVDDRLLSSETCSAVASWMQNELGVLKDLKPGSLKKNLERYRASDLADRVVQEIKAKVPMSGVKKTLIAIDGLEDLVEIQRGRLEKLLMKEATLPAGILLGQTKDEIRLLKDTLVELGKLQLETGIMRRAPKTLSGTVTDQASGEVKHFTWSEEQSKLYAQLESVDFTRIGDAEPAHES